jgi:glutaconate CoA-transferase subunit B
MDNYTASEIMALSAGRLVHNGDILFAGTGLSMLAATVAKRIHAPEAVVFFETGGSTLRWTSCRWRWPIRG